MEEYAQPARKAARDAIQGYQALIKATYNNKSKVFPPTIHAVLYARMAMEAANRPKVEVKARKASSKPKMKMLNAAIANAEDGDLNLRPDSEHLWFHQNFDKILFGTGFRFLGYQLQRRIVRVKDDQGNWKEKEMIVYDDIYDCVPNFFDVGVSRDMQPGMFGGSACYWDRWFTRDAFMEAFNDGFHDNLDAVPEGEWFTESDHMWDVPDGYVRVRYYWNIYKDLYYVQANGIPIRKDFMLDYGDPDRPQKFLPITSIHNDINFDLQKDYYDDIPILQDGRTYTDKSQSAQNKTFWTKSDARLIQSLVGFKNALWGAATDHVKASSVHFLMAANAGVFDQVTSADLYGIIPLHNATGETFNVQSLTQNSAFFNQFVGMDDAVDSAMSWSLGNDWKRAAAELTNEKATVAAIRQQVQRIRMNQNMKFNESGPIKRHYRILVNLIQQYYPEPVLIDLINGEIPEGTDELDIIRDPDGTPVQIKQYKKIPIDDELVEVKKGNRFTLVAHDDPNLAEALRGTGERGFPARAEYIRTEEEPEIYIEPGSTFAELKALERSLNLERLSALQFFMGLAYPTGETDAMGQPKIEQLIPKAGAEYLLRQHAEVWDDDPDQLLGKIEEDDDDQLDEEVPEPFAQIGGMPQPQMPMQSLQGMGGGQGQPTSANLLAESVTP